VAQLFSLGGTIRNSTNKPIILMKKHILTTIGCIAVAFTIAGCSRTANTTTPNTAQQQVSISIADDGALSVSGEQCPSSELTAKLRQLADKKVTSVTVQMSAKTPATQMKAVMDACQAAGIKKISLVTAK